MIRSGALKFTISKQRNLETDEIWSEKVISVGLHGEKYRTENRALRYPYTAKEMHNCSYICLYCRLFENNKCKSLFFQVLQHPPEWEKSNMPLVKELRVSCSGRIESDATNMLHVDFANKYVGGGMLSHGCVQEEILFMLCPELIVSRLLTEVLDDNETLVITGHQRFNDYVGYASSFRWNGDYVDQTDRDAWGRHTTQLVAIDAQVGPILL